jgi:hypothetical protein
MGSVMIVLFSSLLVVLIMVCIARWIFRVNDIVGRLDSIIKLLAKEQRDR